MSNSYNKKIISNNTGEVLNPETNLEQIKDINDLYNRITTLESKLESLINNVNSSLATVAKTGSYTDLINTPKNVSTFINDSNYLIKSDTIDHAINATNSANADKATNDTNGNSITETYATKNEVNDEKSALNNIISNNYKTLNDRINAINSTLTNNFNTLKNSLSTVATSGDYNDLSSVPTKISQFENDRKYLIKTDTIDHALEADHAKKATNDNAGNELTNTYATKNEVTNKENSINKKISDMNTNINKEINDINDQITTQSEDLHNKISDNTEKINSVENSLTNKINNEVTTKTNEISSKVDNAVSGMSKYMRFFNWGGAYRVGNYINFVAPCDGAVTVCKDGGGGALQINGGYRYYFTGKHRSTFWFIVQKGDVANLGGDNNIFIPMKD